ncbi:copper chaperone PCu(A)C [Polymorphobacter sp.]|uniref:copper chaperone PCu(A)C n=1 Tax=Polymorphobacter sp. TaxID=1909290 RepID=UPI003F7235C6
MSRAPIIAVPALMLAMLILAAPATAAPAADGIKDAWVRVNPAPGRPAAGYFTFKNGARPDRLVEAVAQNARVEIHTMSMTGGVMRMQKLDGLDVAANETVTFAPSGKHLMLFDLKAPPATIPITLVFSSGARITTNAEVRKPGTAPKPAANPHAGH